MRPRITKRYSLAFRKQVVAEYEAGASAHSLQQKYGIGGSPTIARWIEQYGTQGIRSQMMRIQKPAEAQENQQLKARIAELEALSHKLALENYMLRCEQELLAQEQPEAAKKKTRTNSSPMPKRGGATRGSK